MSQRGVVMSRLDEIRRKGFTRTSTVVEVEDCEVLNWNRELLIKDSKRGFYSTYKVLPFANWLVNVETVNIESLEDIEITVLFDKYCLYAVDVLTQKQLKAGVCYTDTLLYCDSQRKRYTVGLQKNSINIVEGKGYEKFYDECCDVKEEHTETEFIENTTEAVRNAHLTASLFKNK